MNWKKYFFGFLFLLGLLMFVDWIIFGRTPGQEIDHISNNVIPHALEKIGSQANGALNLPASRKDAGSAHVDLGSDEGRKRLLELVDQAQMRTLTDPEFKQYLSLESQSMKAPPASEDQKQSEYRKIANNFTDDQVKDLAAIASTKSVDINQKILSVYLLSLIDSQADASLTSAIQGLGEIAVNPIQLDGDPKPHTAYEVQQQQERSLRLLALMKLCELSKSSREAYDELQNQIPRIKDSNLVKVFNEQCRLPR